MQKFPCNLTRNIASYSIENLAFHSLLRWKMIILPILTTSLTLFLLRGWENVLFELGSNGVNMRGMYKADELWYQGARNEPVYSLNEFIRLAFNQALPRGELFYHRFSQLYTCCGSGGNNQIWTIGNIINKNRTILYLIRPAEAVMEREQPRSRWNEDKIGGNIADRNAFPNSYV